MLGNIYILKNKINNKLYIGQTIRNIKDRMYSHKCAAVNNKGYYLHNSINKYGINNFDYIYFVLPIFLLDIAEKFLIFLLNTKYPNGFNLLIGGNKNKKYSKIVKEKISKSHKKRPKNSYRRGWKHTEESINKMRIAQKGNKNYWYGKKGKNHHRSKPVICIDTKKYYDSATIAEKKTNILRATISSCCNNGRKKVGGFVWRFAV